MRISRPPRSGARSSSICRKAPATTAWSASGTARAPAPPAVGAPQHLILPQGPRHDGVVGIWYGKGPGVDRCGDVFRHGNAAGSAKNGGVLFLAVDDHGAEASP